MGENMETKRLLELLAYAKVCFEKGRSPFDRVHLAKLNVTAEECRNLSAEIADIIGDKVIDLSIDSKKYNASVLLEEAEKRFIETQT